MTNQCKTICFLFTGFTQGDGRPTGMERVYESLDTFRRPGVHIEIKPWWTDHVALAKFINRQVTGGAYRIVLAGYSYGGYRATRVAQELENLGVTVHRLFLVDAVWRPSYPIPFTKHLPSLLSMSRFPNLHVPANVRRVNAWRQRLGPFAEFPINPMGHNLVIENRGETEFSGFKPLEVVHSECDDNVEVRLAIHRGVRDVIAEFKRLA